MFIGIEASIGGNMLSTAGLEGCQDGQTLVGVGVGSLRVMEFTDLARAAGLRESADAGADVSVPEILGLNRCITPCQREYMLCELAKNEAAKAADPEPATAPRAPISSA